MLFCESKNPCIELDFLSPSSGISNTFWRGEDLEGIKIPGSIQVIGVKRLNRKDRSQQPEASNTSNQWVPTKSIVCTFEGQNLPETVYVWGVSAIVKPYVQRVMQCYTEKKLSKRYENVSYNNNVRFCYHNRNILVTTTIFSVRTTKVHFVVAQFNANKANHVSVSAKCPKIIEQKKINTLMAYRNLSFFEAKALVSSSRNKTDNLSDNNLSNMDQFPKLKQTPISSMYNEQSYASTIATATPDSDSNDSNGKSSSEGASTNNTSIQHVMKQTYTNKSKQQPQQQYPQQHQ
ncbi:hypothetical protein TKK_0002054 [Trichogramma kaykai]